ncbi:MAG: methyltransferase [Desulfobacterales bacterium]
MKSAGKRRVNLTWRLMKAIIILPGAVLVFIPAAILLLSKGTRFSPDLQSPSEVTFLLTMAIPAIGGYLAIRTSLLFTRSGDGTPAPWDPPQKMVITGPYRYVRNPMITGVILILLGETMLFNFWPLFLWMVVFPGHPRRIPEPAPRKGPQILRIVT